MATIAGLTRIHLRCRHSRLGLPSPATLSDFWHSQVALASCRPYSTVPSDSRLVVNGALIGFPFHSWSNFGSLREPLGLAYYNKTRFISVLEQVGSPQLFCRPRRFGKSLTVSILKNFHGVEFLHRYERLFKDLDIHKDVEDGKISSGQYLILPFQFSNIDRCPDIEVAAKYLAQRINNRLFHFLETYDLLQSIGPRFKLDGSPVENLNVVIEVVRMVLGEIHRDRDENHPLHSVEGIYVLADEYDAFANEDMDPNNTCGPELPLPPCSRDFGVLSRMVWKMIMASRNVS
ncbi:hypothetical protein BDD12DRAFT_265362 [Trichophaea hybrida]|nr:hypothetical protein BDD12DRAFT_265362 [Trichophaea hybrida]